MRAGPELRKPRHPTCRSWPRWWEGHQCVGDGRPVAASPLPLSRTASGLPSRLSLPPRKESTMAIWDARVEEKVKRAGDEGLGWVGSLRIPTSGCVTSWSGVWNPPGVMHIPRNGAVVLQARNWTLAPPSGQETVPPSLRTPYLRHLPLRGVFLRVSWLKMYPVQDCR